MERPLRSELASFSYKFPLIIHHSGSFLNCTNRPDRAKRDEKKIQAIFLSCVTGCV